MSEIYLNYGTNLQEMTYALMKEARISERLNASMRVCIKPNLVMAQPAKNGATTHPEIVEGIILYLRDWDIRNIVIAEGASIDETDTLRAFDVCGYTALARKYNVELLDTKKDRVVRQTSQGFKIALCESFLKADYLINVPVLKGHCQTNMTCCLKNLKGCIPDSEKRRFHTIGLHSPIAALAAAIKPDLHIVDGVCGDLRFELGGNPVEANRIMLGFDPVLLDSYGARLIGYQPEEIEHLRLAREYGVGKFADENTKIIEINDGNKPKTQMSASREAQRLGRFIDENGACSACYAALIFAMHQTGIVKPDEKIHIGQGFKGKSAKGIGIGSCAAGYSRSISGCPPKASDIAEFIRKIETKAHTP
jgi:uncharacterized protein (DUF362 family)